MHPLEKERYLKSERARIIKKLTDLIGEGVYPDKNAQYTYWKDRVRLMPPRGFMYVFDIVKDQTILSHGLEWVGYQNNQYLRGEHILQLLHDNQSDIMLYQIYRVHEILAEIDFITEGLDFYYATYRSVRLASGEYYLAYQTSEPFQIDANGRIVSYLSWYHLLSPYQGERMQTYLFNKGQKIKPIFQQMGEKLLKLQGELLQFIGFTSRHKDILQCSAMNMNQIKVTHYLGLSMSTLKNHRSAILNRARVAFPENSFKNYADVVTYLQQQGLLPSIPAQ